MECHALLSKEGTYQEVSGKVTLWNMHLVTLPVSRHTVLRTTRIFGSDKTLLYASKTDGIASGWELVTGKHQSTIRWLGLSTPPLKPSGRGDEGQPDHLTVSAHEK